MPRDSDSRRELLELIRARRANIGAYVRETDAKRTGTATA